MLIVSIIVAAVIVGIAVGVICADFIPVAIGLFATLLSGMVFGVIGLIVAPLIYANDGIPPIKEQTTYELTQFPDGSYIKDNGYTSKHGEKELNFQHVQGKENVTEFFYLSDTKIVVEEGAEPRFESITYTDKSPWVSYWDGINNVSSTKFILVVPNKEMVDEVR